MSDIIKLQNERAEFSVLLGVGGNGSGRNLISLALQKGLLYCICLHEPYGIFFPLSLFHLSVIGRTREHKKREGVIILHAIEIWIPVSIKKRRRGWQLGLASLCL